MMSQLTIDKQTILKYDTPGPRYTSYPTAPEWSNEVTPQVYAEKLKAFGQSDKTLSIYIHIPFCQSMCYYCACNVIIRRHDEKYGDEYLEYVFKEIDLVKNALGRKKQKVRQFHLGGGTPTFLSSAQLERLFKKVAATFEIDFDGEVAIEVDPRTIDHLKIKTLRALGFNRISMGIQDFDAEVQKEVNRVQPLKMVQDLFDWCRALKFDSINVDLIYGLPYQTPKKFSDTVQKIIALHPDRIALYSFAHVPWLKKHQSKLNTEAFPTGDSKLDIFLGARDLFLQNGYKAIAMDHFALSTDEMAKAFHKGVLYRNFMGYTVKPADEFLGLGVTSIGFLQNTFIQNHKLLSEYYALLEKGILPVERGKLLTRDDQIRQWVINSLMCQFKVDKIAFLNRFEVVFDDYFKEEAAHIQKCESDGLVRMSGNTLEITDLGKIFIRNVCMGFDRYLRQAKSHKRFSRTV